MCIKTLRMRQNGPWRISKSWISNRNESSKDKRPETLLEDMELTSLNKWLSAFTAETRKVNGEPYPPITLHLLLSGLQRHMKASPTCANLGISQGLKQTTVCRQQELWNCMKLKFQRNYTGENWPPFSGVSMYVQMHQ